MQKNSPDAYFWLCEASIIKLFYENDYWLFLQKAPL